MGQTIQQRQLKVLEACDRAKAALVTTGDPGRSNYEAYYDDPGQEYDRILRCCQQQFEDMLLSLKRADALRKEHHLSIDIRMSATIGAVRCARLGLSDVQRERRS